MDNQSGSVTPSDAWMVVYVAFNEPEAYVVAGRLESEGVRAMVHQEPVGRAYGLTVGPLGEVKVLVSAEDYDLALSILDDEELESDETALTSEEDDYDDDPDE